MASQDGPEMRSLKWEEQDLESRSREIVEMILQETPVHSLDEQI